MKPVCAILALASRVFAADAGPDCRELVRKAIQDYRSDALAQQRYSYLTTDRTQGKGIEVTRTEPLAGAPYKRLVSRGGKPLTPAEQQREQAKYDAARRTRLKQSPAERERLRRKRESETKFLDDVPNGFNFQLMKEDVVNGRAAYMVKATPKPGYQSHDLKSRMFSKINATIWIEAKDNRMAKAVADVTGAIALGWFMARIGKGGHFELTQTRVPEGVWFPREIDILGSATIFLVGRKSLDEKINFSEYRLGDGQASRAK